MTSAPPPEGAGPSGPEGGAQRESLLQREGEGHAIRVGRIEFVNCFPLYHHFEEELETRGQSATG